MMFRSTIITKIYQGVLVFGRKSSHSFKTPQNIKPQSYGLLVVPVVTFGLGTWQIQRRNRKLNLIKELEEKENKPTVDLIENIHNLPNLEYRKVRVKGFFDHTKEMYIGPRAPIRSESQKEGGIFSTQAQSGNFVVTPFKLVDSDLSILVNRGWVSRSKTPPTSRQEGQVEEEMELVGILRSTETRPCFGPKIKPESRIFYFRDIETLSKKCNTAPIFLDACSTQPGGPIGGQTKVNLRNEHMNYIVTWYSLSAITSWMWYTKFVRVLL